jgi:Raf kinase inhibitor-like YbhB/YbcL family protein
MYKYIPLLIAILLIGGCGTKETIQTQPQTTPADPTPIVEEITEVPETPGVMVKEPQEKTPAPAEQVEPKPEESKPVATPDPVIPEEKPLLLSSSAFSYAGAIPAKYTCDGANINPTLSIGNIREDTKSLALLVDDPDAPAGDWVHWVMWNISPDTKTIAQGNVPAGAVQGKNDFGNNNYGGPCPPSGTHRYMFKLYALDTTLSLPAGSTKAQLLGAINEHTLGRVTLMGKYTR